MAALFLLSALPVSTRSLPALVGATTSTIPLHYVALRCTSFQPYCVCRPLFFQRLLIRPAIGVCSVITLHWNKERPAEKSGTDLYFFPAVTRSQPYSPEKRASRSVVAVRGRNTAWCSSVLLREKLHNPCGASGC
jgi:hypothetical protein